MKNADLPAMPNVDLDIKNGIPVVVYVDKGLTKREYFAGLAMQGLLASNLYDTYDGAGEWKKDTIESAVEYADALLAELEK